MKTYSLKINGHEYNVEIVNVEGGIANVNVNGQAYSVELGNMPAPAAPAPAAAPAPQAAPAPAPQAAAAPAPSNGKGTPVTSPLPGVIVDVCVKEGQAVKAGQKVAVLEAMKMENDIEALQDGVVSEIKVSKGDSVLEGAVVVILA